jgi:hypothetical protein
VTEVLQSIDIIHNAGRVAEVPDGQLQSVYQPLELHIRYPG